MKTKLLFIVVGVMAVPDLSIVRSGDLAATASVGQAKPSAVLPANIQRANSERTGPFRVIGYLEKRDRVITIKSGPSGPAYSVATKEGKVLFENLSTEQLKAKAPDIHEVIKTGVAGDARMLPKIDAGVR